MVAKHVCTHVVCIYVCLSVDLEFFALISRYLIPPCFVVSVCYWVHTSLVRFIYSVQI